jgi:hypothetical protein
VKFEVEGELPDFRGLLNAFPPLSARILGYIGKRAAQQLFDKHLQGQDLNIKNFFLSPSKMPRAKGGLPRRIPNPSINAATEKYDKILGVTRPRTIAGLTGRGRRLVSYSIGRGLKWVAISSFPLNLYENRKQLRKGDAARKGILRRNFNSSLSSRLTSYIAEAENFIVDDFFQGNKPRRKIGEPINQGAMRHI